MKKLQQEIKELYAQEAEEEAGTTACTLKAETIEQTRKQKTEQLQSELEPLVYEYFDLSEEEKILVEDTCNVYEPSSTPATPHTAIKTLRETTRDDRLAYSTLLCDTLNRWSQIDQPKGKKQPFYFGVESTYLNETGMVLVTVDKAGRKSNPRDVPANGQVGRAVQRIANASTARHGTFAYLRGVIVGDSDKIHILKPDLLGQWTKTSALTDADSIFQAIIQSKKNRR
jgi:hypothetical protein